MESTKAERQLYKIGGVATLIIPALYVTAAIISSVGYRDPFPTNVAEWFAVFDKSWLVGLTFLGLADVGIMLLSVPVFLALHAALERIGGTWVKIAAGFAFVAAAIYIATNTAFSMLNLSRQYAAVSSPDVREQLLASGQTLIAISRGTGAHYLGLPLLWAATTIVSAVMLRSDNFGKVVAIIGIIGFPLLLASIPFVGYTTTEALSAVVSVIVIVSYGGGGLLSMLWYVMIGLRLLKLGRDTVVEYDD